MLVPTGTIQLLVLPTLMKGKAERRKKGRKGERGEGKKERIKRKERKAQVGPSYN